jgi:hypothetical protein
LSTTAATAATAARAAIPQTSALDIEAMLSHPDVRDQSAGTEHRASRTKRMPAIRIPVKTIRCDLVLMQYAWTQMEAERAFRRANAERRRAGIARRLRRVDPACGRLAVHEALPTSVGRPGVRDIPLECIVGTVEPNRAYQFDNEFRPAPTTRDRWMRVWMAFNGGASLPPISVVRVGDSYAIRDGHHRVSVARANGAGSIQAHVA